MRKGKMLSKAQGGGGKPHLEAVSQNLEKRKEILDAAATDGTHPSPLQKNGSGTKKEDSGSGLKGSFSVLTRTAHEKTSSKRGAL